MYRVVTTVAIVLVDVDARAGDAELGRCALRLETHLAELSDGATVHPRPDDPGSYDVTCTTQASTLSEAIYRATNDLSAAAFAAGASVPGGDAPDSFDMWVTERFVRATLADEL
jgi:hypothetical protein